MVCHSIDFGKKRAELLASVPEAGTESASDSPPVVIVGGGKSAQDIAAYLANERRKVTMVCPDFDAFTAREKPLPDFIRKSR